jgi:hypothetical protein
MSGTKGRFRLVVYEQRELRGRASRPLCIIEQWSSMVAVSVKNTYIILFIYFTLPSSHCRKSFLLNSPIISISSAVVRSRYNRMMCPHTLHKSSHSTSNNSHQQFSELEGKEIPSRRVVSRMAALTTVGTAYKTYTGVCNLFSVQFAPRQTAQKYQSVKTHASLR